MAIIRTPEKNFEHLSDFTFTPNYLNFDGKRIHYLDENHHNQATETILCLHGEPSWCYLYRKMIPILSKKYRVVCFDFIGFGKSDKLTDLNAYNYLLHYNTLKTIIDQLQLKNITLVVQDWGGLIGLPFATDYPDLFSRLVIMNTMIPSARATSKWRTFLKTPPFFLWRAFSKYYPNLPIGKIIQWGTVSKLSPAVIAAYNAPFPDKSYKAGAKAWPALVPIFAHNPAAEIMQATRKKLGKWQKPTLVLFSDSDPITGSHVNFFKKRILGAQQQNHVIIKKAGHFLQEDKGEEIAEHIVKFIAKN